VNHVPVISANNLTTFAGQVLSASSLFTASDADGDASIARYNLYADNANGHFVVNGVAQPSAANILVDADQLGGVSFVSGSGANNLWVKAFDGQGWGAWKEFSITPASSAFALVGEKWGASAAAGTGGGVVTWSVATSNLAGQDASFSGFLTSEMTAEVHQAFDRWSSVANITFAEVTDSAAANIRFGLLNMDGVGGQLGYSTWHYTSGLMQRAEVKFDNLDGWHASSAGIVNGNGFSFSAIALHEIGHAIGMDHYTAETEIMNPFLHPGITDLQAGDIAGAQTLYGIAEGWHFV
jgi:hypothetical protein